MSIIFGGDGLNRDYYEIKNLKHKSVISVVCRISKRLFAIAERSLLNEKLDGESNVHVVQKQIKCAVSSCLDKHTTCCKACDIKKCRYKCNYADKKVCEHQYT